MEKLNMKTEALEYATKGIPIFRVMAKRNDPAQGIEATNDLALVENYWRFNFNIGMPTGNKSGILVMTFSHEDYAVAQDNGLPVTPVATTGKGINVFFKYKIGIENQLNKDAFGDVLILGEDKYALLPPSVVALQSSPFSKPEVYSWCEGKSIFDVPPAEVPNWMLMGKHAEIEIPAAEEIQVVQVEDVPNIIEYDHAEEVADAELEFGPSIDNKHDPVANEWKAPNVAATVPWTQDKIYAASL